jgi:hypothetical protein
MTLTSAHSSAKATDHGLLTGLADNDHTQYLLTPPAWTDFTPVGSTGGGGLTFTVTAVDFARYIYAGKICHFELQVTATIGGTSGGSSQLELSAPWSSKYNNTFCGGWTNAAGSTLLMGALYGNKILIYKPAVTAWTTESGKGFRLSGTFEIA